MKCIHCRQDMTEKNGNQFIERKGIDVTLVGTPFFVCESCQVKALPKEIEDYVERMIEEKRTKFPDSPPALYLMVDEFLKENHQ